MTRRMLLAAGMLLICLPGCPHNKYVIEMKPAGNVIERRLTVSREGVGKEDDPNVPAEEAELLAKAYGKPAPPKAAREHTFAGRFSGKMPEDVGGAGSHAHFATRMGTASLYVERFRGNDDPAGQAAQIHAAADTITDLLVGWFAAELGKDQRFERLRRFMDEKFRKDLKNLTTYHWLKQLRELQAPPEPGGTSPDEELAARLAQYLHERGYFAADDLPWLVRTATETSAKDAGAHLPWAWPVIRRLVAARMGVPDDKPVPRSLDFLAGPEAAQKSLTEYVRTAEKYKKWAATTRKQTDKDSPVVPPEVLDAAELLLSGIGPDTPDELIVKLALPHPPTHTNGKWDEKTGQVSWRSGIEGRVQVQIQTYGRMPFLLYAVWSSPEERFQKRHFGKVVLKESALVEYCLWRAGLTKSEGEQWDEFLAGLAPGEALKGKLDAFVFAHERGKKDPPESLAVSALRLIREGLKAEKPNPASKPGAGE